MSCKYIFVLGGVVSGCGKGVTAASLGYLLTQRGCSVSPIKFDPYFNASASVLRPGDHGEPYVTDDGCETDLDLGHSERFLGKPLSAKNICTSGLIFKELLQEEEAGEHLGSTLQVSPHLIDKFHDKIRALEDDSDVVVIEVGGTVGDPESDAFMQAVSSLQQQRRDDVLIAMVAPILWLNTVKEFKTKPLQQSVRTLRSYGIQPDLLLCRTDRQLPGKILDKVALLTNVPRDAVFDAPDVDSIYRVPLEFYDRNIDDFVVDRLRIKRNGCRIQHYRKMVEGYLENHDLPSVSIAVVGKYENCEEAYLSLKEALFHAGVANQVRVNIHWVSAESLEHAKDMRGVWKNFENDCGMIVPGGFGARGIEGKIRAVRYVRERKIPFLGICLGLQCAVIEAARNILNLEHANSAEFDPDTTDPVVYFVEGQEGLRKKAGTMRLGAYECELVKDSLIHSLYKKRNISERHRHRFEVNKGYVERLSKAGFRVSGINPQSGLVEMMEWDTSQHPYFVATQAHPEFKSRLGDPAPLFNGLVAAALKHQAAHTN